MQFSRRSLSFAGLSLVAMAVLFAACTDDGQSPVGPPEPPIVTPPRGPSETIAVECRASTRTQSVVCGTPTSRNSGISTSIVGQQNVTVQLISSNVHIVADTFAFDMQVRNVLRQPVDHRPQMLGTSNGTTPVPITVFFYSGPTVLGLTSGEVNVVADDTVNLTGGAAIQPAYVYDASYNVVLDSGEVTLPKRWKLTFDPKGVEFTFVLLVDAALTLPKGWVDVTTDGEVPGSQVEVDSVRLTAGNTRTLKAITRHYTGYRMPNDTTSETVVWSSLYDSVATVDPSTGVVSAVGEGVTRIRATSTVDGGRFGEVVVTVPPPPTFNALMNVTATVAAPGLKVEANAPGKVVAGTFPTAQGGTVQIDSTGAFRYSGKGGFTGDDTFPFSIIRKGVTFNSTAKVKVASSNYWYVKANAPADSAQGTQRFPFVNVKDAQAAGAAGPEASDSIFVVNAGAVQLDSAVVLESGQALIGEGIPVPLVVALNGAVDTLLGSAGSSEITRTLDGPAVTLSTNNILRGLVIKAADGAAITGNGFGTLTAIDLKVDPTGPALHLTNGTLAASFLLLSSTGSATQGLFLSNVGGSLTADGGSIQNAAGRLVDIANSTVNLTYPGAISGAGDGISLTGNSGGATFSGALNLTGKGIVAQGNTGGTFAFTGATKTIAVGTTEAGVTLATNTGATFQFGGGNLAISTAAGTAFSATGGGTVTVTGANNTVATTTGAPVVLDGVGTGAAGTGVTFVSVGKTGGSTGIVINAITGAGFQVTGTGSAGSGGSITAAGNGVLLTSLATGTPVALTNLSITGSGAAAAFSAANADSVAIAGVSVSATGGPALSVTSSRLFGNFSSLTSSATTSSAVILQTAGGTFGAATATLTGTVGGPTVAVTGGAPTFSIAAGTITNDNGRAAVVNGLTGGSVSIASAVNSGAPAGTGILVQNNTGGTTEFVGGGTLTTGAASAVTLSGNATAAIIRFAGPALAITTTTGTGFNADGGGTLEVTGVGKTVSSTGGVAVRILNTKIDGTSGAVFQNVSATGGANGIVLQNTTTGVVGVQGGTISGTTGAGVQLTSTAFATLNNLSVNAGTTGAAIAGTSFGTLTVGNSTVTAGTGPALALTTGALKGTFASVGGTVVGAVKGVVLAAVTDSFTVSGGTLVGGSDSAVVVRGGTVAAGWAGAVSQANNFPLLAVSGIHQTGTLGFTGSITATGGTGLQFNNADGIYKFTGTVSMNGGDAGIDVANNSDGDFSFSANTTVNNPTGSAITVQNSTGGLDFTYSGSFTKNNNATTGILVQNNAGGNVTFNGTTKLLSTGTATAVNLASNGSTSIQFAGGALNITTTTGNGFSATGGGTVQVTGAGNTVTSAGGIAVNVVSTSIGAGGMAFLKVTATGGANGIVLNNTGNLGGFTVTGDGASSAANTTRGRTTAAASGGTLVLGSGGTISGTTGAGVSLTNASTVVLRNMVLQNNSGDGITAAMATGLTVDNTRITGHASDHGILGTNVAGLTLTHSEVENNATTDGVVEGPDIWNVRLVDFTGTGTIQNSRLRQAEETVLGVVNDAGTGTITITNTNITDAGTTAGNGVQVTARGSSNLTLTMQNDSVNRTKARGVTAVADGNATLAVNVSGSKFRDNFSGLEVATTSLGPTTYNLVGNDFQWHESVPININRGSLGATPVTGSFRGTVENNTVGTAGQVGSGSSTANAAAPGGRGQGGVGIRVATNGQGGDTRVRIKGNTVREVINLGVNVIGRDGAHGLSVIYENNDVELPNHNLVSHASDIQAGASPTDQVSMCLDARNNRSISPFGNGLRVRTNSGVNTTTNNQVALAQWDGVTAVNTFLANQNPTLGDNVTTATSGGPFTATPSCAAP